MVRQSNEKQYAVTNNDCHTAAVLCTFPGTGAIPLQPVKVPLELGIPGWRGSIEQAIRRERARHLKMDSEMW
ncbi:hypothetical protein LBMAG46_13020 [Planctomycetia bacterium]|nr:hypothetical protein LBMAG46_13020 [Planctomycetia bacterium]